MAQLVVEQRAQVLFGGQTVQANDSRMVSLLRKDADKAQVRLRVRMSDRLLRATGELMRDLFDLKTVPSNEDKLVAELKERLEGLREVCVAMARDYYTGIPVRTSARRCARRWSTFLRTRAIPRRS